MDSTNLYLFETFKLLYFKSITKRYNKPNGIIYSYAYSINQINKSIEERPHATMKTFKDLFWILLIMNILLKAQTKTFKTKFAFDRLEKNQ